MPTSPAGDQALDRLGTHVHALALIEPERVEPRHHVVHLVVTLGEQPLSVELDELVEVDARRRPCGSLGVGARDKCKAHRLRAIAVGAGDEMLEVQI